MTSKPTVDQDAESDADDVTPHPLPRRLSQLTWHTWRGILRGSVVGYFEHECLDAAAAMTYKSVTALIPSLVAIVSLINLVTDGAAVLNAVIDILRDLGLGSVVANQALLGVVQTLLVQQSSAKALFGSSLAFAAW